MPLSAQMPIYVIGSGLVVAAVARRKGRSGMQLLGWFGLGSLLFLPALLAVLFVRDQT